jgi:glutathione S-transferase
MVRQGNSDMARSAIVFGSRLSPFVEKVVRALAMKGIGFRLVEPRGPGDFGKWNPQTRKMPALELDGERMYDSTFIVRRLDAIVPEPALVALDPRVAAAQRQLEDWADESLYWYGMALRWCTRNKAATARQILGALSAPLRAIASVILPRQIRASTMAQGLGRLPHDVLVRELGGHLDDLMAILDRRPFFFGDRASVADLAVYGQFCMLRSGPTPEAEALLRQRTGLLDHMRRVEEVAAVS